MTYYTMTEQETQQWETSDEARRAIRQTASKLGRKVEIYSADGVLMDVVEEVRP